MAPGITLNQAFPDLFTQAQSDFLARLEEEPLSVLPRQRLVTRGEPLAHAAYVSKGFVGRYRADWAGRRQLLSLQIPGDFIDLHSYRLGHLDHDIDSFTAVTCCRLPHTCIAELRETHPEIYDNFWRISLTDAAMHRYWAFRVGRLMGRARIANFFAEVFARLFSRGLCGPDGYDLPLTQADIGEACGMTPVHANRMLGELREEGICTLDNGRVVIHNFPQLAKVGQFEWDYLYLSEQAEEELCALMGRGTVRARRHPAGGMTLL